MNINIIKEEVSKNLNKKVEVCVKAVRNKSYKVVGVITNVYPSIFVVNSNGVDKCFSYSDIVIGEISIKYL